jgi:acyl-coenzyme A synthetase/AMP-(fatty) acid ligase
MIEHEALLNRIHWMQKRYRLTANDCVLQKTPYSFDVSVWEFWWTLTEGAKLVMAKPGGHRDPAYLQAIIQVHDVTTLHFVPSMLASMLTHARWDACTSVRQVFCSGEALPRNLVADFRNTGTQSELHNLYGPTEAAIDVTYWDCRAYDNVDVIPIGKPIDNIQIYILDGQGQPVPKGVAGELHIGGTGLARGYIGNAELTAEKFVQLPLRNGDSTTTPRLYKTGDLACWNEHGDIEYLGRIDNQVKLNGLRIELGEIETQLARHEAVREVVVMACSLDHQSAEDRQLVAYVVPQPGEAFAAVGEERDAAAAKRASYRAFLRETLPDYMVPAVFIELENLPTTHNGKLDRKSLPTPTALDIGRHVYAPPRNHWEVRLCAIYQDVLDLEQIGIHDNYFELGGNSLGTVQIVSAAKQEGMPLTVGQVFKYPTVAQLAELMAALTEQASATVPNGKDPSPEHGAMHDQPEVIS